ncbi:hypothetical protein [Flavobacterium sp. WC2509]
MKNKATQTSNTAKTAKLQNLKTLSRKQLEAIFGGDDDTTRGTKTDPNQ